MDENKNPKSWKPAFLISDRWSYNGQRFATEKEALRSARRRFWSWTVPTDYSAHPSDEPVSYRNTEETDDEYINDAGKASDHADNQ